MIGGLLGKKIGMTQIFKEDGTRVPVTVLKAGPCHILQVKTPDKDGYTALQLGFEDKKEKVAIKPELGHTKKIGQGPKRVIREVAYTGEPALQAGQALGVEVFQDTKRVDVTGITKGKGFQGVMKRWGFKGGPMTHGSTRHRAPGSIGSNTDPARVWKGKKMAGHMGQERVTIQNLEIIRLDREQNLLLVKGAVPGSPGTYVIIKKSVKEGTQA
jgi:large subunit ribosomal protein L3